MILDVTSVNMTSYVVHIRRKHLTSWRKKVEADSRLQVLVSLS